MTSSTAIIPTPAASRYLQQLCRHFGHKVPVEFTADAGLITLPFGECRLSATEGTLTLTATSAMSDLPRLERVIGDHLARFAFRERPTINWQHAA